MKDFFSGMALNIVLLIFFIIGFWIGLEILGLPLMACMFTGAAVAMLPLYFYIINR